MLRSAAVLMRRVLMAAVDVLVLEKANPNRQCHAEKEGGRQPELVV